MHRRNIVGALLPRVAVLSTATAFFGVLNRHVDRLILATVDAWLQGRVVDPHEYPAAVFLEEKFHLLIGVRLE